MAAQPLDPYFLPALVLMADGRDRTRGRYRQDFFDRIQATASLRREAWTSPRHEQFQRVATLVAAALVKAGLLRANADGVLSITAQSQKLLATNPRLITFDDLSKRVSGGSASSSSRAKAAGDSSYLGIDLFFGGDNLFDLFDLGWQAFESVLSGFDW